MIKFFRKQMNKKGFTLIELIVVIAILGILAAIAIPRFSAVQSNAEASALKADASVLTSAAQLYAASNSGAFPTGTVDAAADALVAADLLSKKPSAANIALLTYDSATGIFTVTTP